MASNSVLTATEVAERLGIQHRRVQRWAQNGNLTPLRHRPLLFDAEEVDRKAAELAEELRARLALLAGEQAS